MKHDVDQLRNTTPFDRLVGSKMVEASGSRCVMTLEVRPEHHQPQGIVHGGVIATLIETSTSFGASLWLEGRSFAMGVTNSTDFLRAVRTGTLTFTATPIQQGRTLQLWEVAVTDEQDRLVAHGKVKLYNRYEDG